MEIDEKLVRVLLESISERLNGLVKQLDEVTEEHQLQLEARDATIDELRRTVDMLETRLRAATKQYQELESENQYLSANKLELLREIEHLKGRYSE